MEIIGYLLSIGIGIILGLLGGGGSILSIPILVYFFNVDAVLASAYSLFLKKWTGSGVEKKGYQMIAESHDNMVAFIIGNIVAFVVAMLAIKFFINFLKVYGFKVFGIYRIVAGIFLLILIFAGYLK